MAFSLIALQAAPAMEDAMVERRTPHDLGRIGQLADEPLACFPDLVRFRQG